MSLVRHSGRIFRLLMSAAWAGLIGHVVVSCSSNSAIPPELGDCVKVGDAACTTPDPGGGGGSGPGGGDSGGAGDTGSVTSGCGTAQALLASENTSCVPCVEGEAEAGGSGCCGADMACSSQTACLNLLQCMVGCSASDTTCQNTCENTNPNGVAAYNDFAACLAQNCSPQCPTLPTGGTADF
ncbi:MAG: hypothetical protein ABSE49_01855 [Polyangiaceae bacterium]